ncbi:hypothetical protein [Roseateles sp.]|uniref:hypothetical protein n=1 Tax=Roseateles sp. TaxID=1971397 RepID=UPI003BA85AA0
MKLSLLALASFTAMTGAAHAQVVNIDATRYGFAFPTDPAPVVGQVITPITNPGGDALLQLTLGPGTYGISNATGLAGANPAFTGWNFSGGWVWSVVIADDTTHQVVYYADRGGVQGSQAAIAAQADVQSFHDTFTLAQATTLDFMIRDYYLPDNAGGVAVNISAVPEAPSTALLALGLLVLALRRRSRRGD